MQDDTVELGFNKRVGARLREFRKEKGWSQRQLAAALQGDLKLDPSAITRIERGDRSLKLREASALADVLDVGLYHLVAQGDDPHEAELNEFIDAAQQGIQKAREKLVGVAIMYTLAVNTIQNHPKALYGIGSLEFLADEVNEVASKGPEGRLHLDDEHYALIEEILRTVATGSIARVDPDESDT